MSQEASIQLFENAKIRVVWDDVEEKYYFSVVDVIQVLTDSADGRTYWKVLKNRLIKEGNETVTNCNQLKLPAADGKMRLTDVADLEQILRIVQSIPSKKAEPMKRWLAQVAKEGGDVAKAARNQLEATIGESVVSPNKAIDYIKPQDELPFENEPKNEKF